MNRKERQQQGQGRKGQHDSCYFCASTGKLKSVAIAHRGMKQVCVECMDLVDIYLEPDHT